MGFDCELHPLFSFTYRTGLPNGLIEHEFDHVLIGDYDGVVSLDPGEAEDYIWTDFSGLYEDMTKNKGNYTAWFIILMDTIMQVSGAPRKDLKKMRSGDRVYSPGFFDNTPDGIS